MRKEIRGEKMNVFGVFAATKFPAPFDAAPGLAVRLVPLTSEFFSFRREFACHFTAKKLNKLKPARRPSQVRSPKQMDWADGKEKKKEKKQGAAPGWLAWRRSQKDRGKTT